MDMNSSQPIVTGRDRVFVSSEKSEGGATIEVKRSSGKWETRQVWRTRGLNARFCSPIFYKGHLFVLTDGRLTCVNADDGKRVWLEGNYGNGQIVRAGDVLLITSERGKVHLVAADPAEWRELDSVPVFTARTWNMPALAGHRLYLRNHYEMACLELPTAAK
jgi:outer membrane protein assembly factor BamB